MSLAARTLALISALVLSTGVVLAGESAGPGSWIQEPSSPFYFALLVRDVDAEVSWYRTALGVEVVSDTTAEDGAWRIANLRKEQLFVEIIRDARATEADRPFGFRKVGFGVPDVVAVADRVEKATGARPKVLDFREFGVRIIQFHDPEGNTLQLFSPLPAAE